MRLPSVLSLVFLLNVVPFTTSLAAAQEQPVTTTTTTESSSTTTTNTTTTTTITTNGIAEAVTIAATAAATEPAVVYHASCQAGFSLAEGNTSSRSLASGCDASREGEFWLFAFKGNVRYGNNRFGGPQYPGGMEQPRGDFILVENNFFAALRQDRFLTRSKSQYVFLVESYAGDQFKGFWNRGALQAGYGYAFINAEDAKLKLEAGVEYSRDRLVQPNANHSLYDDRMAAVGTLLGEKAFNENVAINGLVTYSRNLEDGRDYRVKSELGLTAKINSAVSFKTAGILNFENLPKLVEPVDKTGAKIGGAPTVPALKTDITWVNLVVVAIY